MIIRPLNVIVSEIRKDWKNPYFGCVPYLNALEQVVDGWYFYDDEETIINYFLANAQSWRGETAKRVKAELKARIKELESAR